ncbi:unnamed protein product [Trichobilharzia szidati]|nr:unnamed protein product [Trichobilharzia szidati]
MIDVNLGGNTEKTETTRLHLAESVHVTGTFTPRLYGSPKVHKNGVPLRPVLDMLNSPYHPVAKWLVELLQPLHTELVKHSVKDTFGFVERIRDFNVDNKFMISFDVSSLFTSLCTSHGNSRLYM